MIWLVACALGALVWRWRLGQFARRSPPAVAPRLGRVSLIVPARDEAHNLPRLLASIARLDPAPAEVIVVDDHSTDGTGDLARAAGATVVVPQPLPPGWLGKSWACRAGAAAATGDVLLFTDADTEHGPASLGLALAAANDAALVSIVPTHRVVSWWERLQGPFLALLLVAGRAGAEATRGARRFAIGQYLLFDRAAYDRLGGHDAVRGEIAEDLRLAEAVVDGGGRCTVLRAPGALQVRMYPEGLGAFFRGWRRSFRAGLAAAGLGGTLETVAVIGWLLGVPLRLGLAIADADATAIAVLGGLYLATAAMLAYDQRHAGKFRAWSALIFPLPVLAFVAISAVAAVDGLRRAPVRWRGRAIPPVRVRS